MAQLGAFNPAEVQDDREIIPAGNYLAHIIESELAWTRSGGQMLKLTWEIIDGPLAKRRVWDNLNIVNANSQAQQIAERSLKRICDAVGFAGVLTNSEQLHLKPVLLTVAVRPPEGEYGEQNTVKGYKPASGGVTAVGAPAPSAVPSAAPATMPWKAAG